MCGRLFHGEFGIVHVGNIVLQTTTETASTIILSYKPKSFETTLDKRCSACLCMSLPSQASATPSLMPKRSTKTALTLSMLQSWYKRNDDLRFFLARSTIIRLQANQARARRWTVKMARLILSSPALSLITKRRIINLSVSPFCLERSSTSLAFELSTLPPKYMMYIEQKLLADFTDVNRQNLDAPNSCGVSGAWMSCVDSMWSQISLCAGHPCETLRTFSEKMNKRSKTIFRLAWPSLICTLTRKKASMMIEKRTLRETKKIRKVKDTHQIFCIHPSVHSAVHG
mmetsp:Transcript_99522/g.319383  ORF Transcript_99522/g.319383 Transcript_99522/m.319383 type:complete len:285 (+) Transcript_99522:13-867(+)